MTQEEKAKKYEQTLERAREAKQNTESAVTIGILEEIFPELRESEDEGMKKELIKFLQECHNIDSGFFSRYCEIPFAQMLAWLEKQGEPTEINPSEFDLRLNKLLKQFETLPKEELISNLSYYLNVIQNDGTYKIEKQGEQKPAWREEDDIGLDDALWCCKQAASIAKDENDMGNTWYAEKWLKSLKQRIEK